MEEDSAYLVILVCKSTHRQRGGEFHSCGSRCRGRQLSWDGDRVWRHSQGLQDRWSVRLPAILPVETQNLQGRRRCRVTSSVYFQKINKRLFKHDVSSQSRWELMFYDKKRSSRRSSDMTFNVGSILAGASCNFYSSSLTVLTFFFLLELNFH